ncbi:hypothetical protein PTKIN_Ptkin13bG0251900 [Pterospermum kingtungense]
MQEFIRLSVCSKRLRQICYSVQHVTFEQSTSDPQKKDLEFLSYSRFLIDWGDMNLRHLRIRWEYGFHPWENIRGERFIYCVGTWLHYAVRHRLVSLYLHLTGNKDLPVFSLPHCLLSCGTLKYMTVDLNDRRLDFPSTTGFINLWQLHLRNIIISDERSSANLLSTLASLRCLKELWIENVDGIGTIEMNSSSLKKFECNNKFCNLKIRCELLEYLHLNWKFNNSTKASLNVCAPNLREFHWRGNLPESYCFDKFAKLDVAKIILTYKKFDDSQNLRKAIRCVGDTKNLYLDVNVIEDQFKQNYLPIMLHNVQNLSLYIYEQLNFDSISAIGSFLRGTSNLKTLKIKSFVNFSNNDVQGVDMKFWESQNLAFMHQLQMVKLELLNGVTELQLARFFLKHAKELKKMVIFHPSSLPTYVSQEVNELKRAFRDRVVFKVKQYI